MITSELLENEENLSSFFKLERRTSLIYKELLSRGIMASSAYKLPDSLKRIYDRSISNFNYDGSEEKENNLESSNKTPSPLRKRQHIIDVLSKCRMSVTCKRKSVENSNVINEEKLEMSFDTEKESEKESGREMIKKKSIFYEEERFCRRLNFNSSNLIKIQNFAQRARIETLPFNFSPEKLEEISEKFENLNEISRKEVIIEIKECPKGSDSVINWNKIPKNIVEIKSAIDCESHNRFIFDMSSYCENKEENENFQINNKNSPEESIPQFNNTEIFCRICKEDYQTADNILISPCNCEGLVKYTHSQCIFQFFKDFQNFKNKVEICEICNEEYKYVKTKTKKCKFLLFENFKYTALFMTLMTPLILIFFSFFIKNLIIWEYHFEEILVMAITGILIICVLHVFKEVLKFKICENWVIYNRISRIDDGKVDEDKQTKREVNYLKARSHSPKKKNNKNSFLMNILRNSVEKIKRNFMTMSNQKVRNGIYRTIESDASVSEFNDKNENDRNDEMPNKVLEYNNENNLLKRISTMPVENKFISETPQILYENMTTENAIKIKKDKLKTTSLESNFFEKNNNLKSIQFRSNIIKKN